MYEITLFTAPKIIKGRDPLLSEIVLEYLAIPLDKGLFTFAVVGDTSGNTKYIFPDMDNTVVKHNNSVLYIANGIDEVVQDILEEDDTRGLKRFWSRFSIRCAKTIDKDHCLVEREESEKLDFDIRNGVVVSIYTVEEELIKMIRGEPVDAYLYISTVFAGGDLVAIEHGVRGTMGILNIKMAKPTCSDTRGIVAVRTLTGDVVMVEMGIDDVIERIASHLQDDPIPYYYMGTAVYKLPDSYEELFKLASSLNLFRGSRSSRSIADLFM